MNVIRTLKFGLKVQSREAWEYLLRWSKSCTLAYNYASILVQADDRHRQESIDCKFEEWKKEHPEEASKYDEDMAKYNDFLETKKMSKKGECPYPEEVERPKRPVKLESDVKKKIDLDTARRLWEDQRDLPSTTFKVGDKEFPASGTYSVTYQETIKGVMSSVNGAITRRTQGYCASFPREKPSYADTPIHFYKPCFEIEKQEVNGKTQWTLALRVPRDGDPHGIKWLRLRFFPTREDFNPSAVKGVQISRKTGSDHWQVCFSTRVETTSEILPYRTVGPDINSSDGNTVVVSDKNGEFLRMGMPPSLEEIQRKIEDTQRRKSLLLNNNGNNFRSRKAKKLRKKLRKMHSRAANIRANALHHMSKNIIMSGNTVAIEDLDVEQMVKSAKGVVGNPGTNVARKSNLNRRMLGVAPAKLRSMIEYKSHEIDNSKVVLVNPAWTSQECCFCRVVNR